MIRLAKCEDVEKLVELDRKIFNESLSVKRIENLVKSGRSEIQVLRLDNQIVGMSALIFIPKISTTWLYSIGLLPQYIGRGNGRWLLFTSHNAARCCNCKRIVLEVNENNQRAIRFYENNGYKVLEYKKSYYKDGSGAYRYMKQLEGQAP